MYKYLANSKEKQQIFYYKQHMGIFEITKKLSGWSDEQLIYPNGSEVFFAYSDNECTTHIITENNASKLVYIRGRNDEWENFDICTIKDGIKIKKIMIGENSIGKNLFYSAEYQDEIILVHCVLGDKAMPEAIDTLLSENFFVYNEKVYYTNTQGQLGYKSYADGKPVKFVKISEGVNPYILRDASDEYTIYQDENSIYVNGEKYCTDRNVKNPILVRTFDKIILMWTNGDFVKYLPYDEESRGKKPIRYVSSGIIPDLFVLSDGKICSYYYGIVSGKSVKFFSNADPFYIDNEKRKDNTIFLQNQEIASLRESISHIKKETQVYKKEIKRLNKLLDGFNENEK